MNLYIWAGQETNPCIKTWFHWGVCSLVPDLKTLQDTWDAFLVLWSDVFFYCEQSIKCVGLAGGECRSVSSSFSDLGGRAHSGKSTGLTRLEFCLCPWKIYGSWYFTFLTEPHFPTALPKIMYRKCYVNGCNHNNIANIYWGLILCQACSKCLQFITLITRTLRGSLICAFDRIGNRGCERFSNLSQVTRW